MKPFVFGAIAAVLGAIVWGGIAIGTGYEIGWIAVGIGFLVGFAVVLGEGRGVGAASLAVALTVASICVGKVYTVQHFVGSALDDPELSSLVQAMYDETYADAQALGGLSTNEEIGQFMVDRGYTEAGSVQELSAAEVAEFRGEAEAHLRNFTEMYPTFDSFQEEMQVDAGGNVGILEALSMSLGVMDLLFFAIAIGAAFKVVAQNEA